MTARAAAIAALVAFLPAPLPAQWGGYASLGVRYGTALVSDSIVRPLEVRQAIAPVLTLGLITPSDERWSGEAALDVTFTGIRRDEAGATVDLGSLTTLSFTVAVRRGLAADLSARAGAGALFYRPEREAGIFSGGTSGAAPVGLLGVTWAPPAGRRYGLALDLRYDVHRFITPALKSVGFGDSRIVHRLAFALRAGIGGAR